jgi:hypothetical protein
MMAENRVKRFADGPELRRWALDLTDEEKESLGIAGIEVSERGRFHSDLVRAFNRSHKAEGVMYVPIGRTQPRINSVFEEAMEKLESDKPEQYRQPKSKAEEVKAPTRLPVPTEAPQAQVMAMPGAPEPVMDLLRTGAHVIVIYVPLQLAAAG